MAAGDDAFRERTIEAEATSEEAVVSKQARVTGEVVISKDVEQRTETVSDTVRSTEVEIEDDRTATGKTTLDRSDGKSLKRSA
jgi:stress response protein YsnF